LFPADGIYAPDDPLPSIENESSHGGLVFFFVVLIALFIIFGLMCKKGVFRDCKKHKSP